MIISPTLKFSVSSNWPDFWHIHARSRSPLKPKNDRKKFWPSEESVKRLMRGYTIVKILRIFKMREIIELEKEFPVLSILEW